MVGHVEIPHPGLLARLGYHPAYLEKGSVLFTLVSHLPFGIGPWLAFVSNPASSVHRH